MSDEQPIPQPESGGLDTIYEYLESLVDTDAIKLRDVAFEYARHAGWLRGEYARALDLKRATRKDLDLARDEVDRLTAELELANGSAAREKQNAQSLLEQCDRLRAELAKAGPGALRWAAERIDPGPRKDRLPEPNRYFQGVSDSRRGVAGNLRTWADSAERGFISVVDPAVDAMAAAEQTEAGDEHPRCGQCGQPIEWRDDIDWWVHVDAGHDTHMPPNQRERADVPGGDDRG